LDGLEECWKVVCFMVALELVVLVVVVVNLLALSHLSARSHHQRDEASDYARCCAQ
jgi:uncharacterized protein YpmS